MPEEPTATNRILREIRGLRREIAASRVGIPLGPDPAEMVSPASTAALEGRIASLAKRLDRLELMLESGDSSSAENSDSAKPGFDDAQPAGVETPTIELPARRAGLGLLDLIKADRAGTMMREREDDPFGLAAPPLPEGKGTCYARTDCRGEPISTDVTIQECRLDGGCSWKGPAGCQNFMPMTVDGETPVAINGGTRPRQYTRQDCSFSVVVRRTTGQIYLDTSSLQVTTNSEEFRSTSTLRRELRRLIQRNISAEIKSTVTGLSLQSAASASLSEQETNEAVDTYLDENAAVLVHWVVTIAGVIVARKDWTVEELWDWVGKDCTKSDPMTSRYTLTGPSMNIEVSTTFHIWELYAPQSDRPKGRPWAENEATRQHNNLLRRGAWLPELPLPGGFPSQPNIG